MILFGNQAFLFQAVKCLWLMEASEAKGTFLFGLKIVVKFYLILNAAFAFVHPSPNSQKKFQEILSSIHILEFFHTVITNAGNLTELIN